MEKKTKIGRSRSNSNQSLDSHKFQTTNTMLNTPCYVPGGDLLPILIRNDNNTNGDPFNNHQHQHLYDTTEMMQQQQQQQPEMCDSACQTRESLFTTHLYGGSCGGTGGISSEHSTPNHSITSTNSKPSPPAPFSTFGYKKDNNLINNSCSSSTSNKYRAEAKIEMEKIDKKQYHQHQQQQQQQPRYEDKRRPYSVQTTKSAPDVIVTH